MGEEKTKTKRLFTCVLLAAVLFFVFPLNCFALEAGKESIVTYFEDGSYMTEKVYAVQTRASGTVTGSKVKNYYDSDGNLDWKAVLTGTFSYTGSSATCTAASCNVTIYDSSWHVSSKSASKSGNTAYGTVTMEYKLLGVTVDKKSTDLSLQCDANGNLS